MSEQPQPESEPKASEVEPATAAAPAPAKKKRKRGEKREPAAPVVLPGEGTPEGELLRDANAAFEAGNYARVRALTATLAKASDPLIVDAAADLRRRVSVDPVQIWFLLACLLALITITYVYILS
ncbi:MAG: hypothetical protein M3Y87_09650 [Myxococcota bacterium]|nr:hypothetical protein [Myxococcota bacterium]